MTVVVPTTADVLRGIAEEVRRDPSIWTQGCLWRDAEGRDCEPEPAVCACSIGLIELALTGSARVVAREALWNAVGSRGVAAWNDEPGRTAEGVANAFERAARMLSVRGAS